MRELKPKELRVVIPSRQRAQLLVENALRLFPYATVTVAESELDEYRAVLPADLLAEGRLVPHPDSVTGIAPIRQWCLDNFDEEALVFADDDTYRVQSLVGIVPVPITDVGDILQILENTATVAAGVGAPVFGFDQSFDVRKFSPFKPFSFNAWSGGVIGMVGRSIRYDPGLRLRADIDYCLQALLSPQHRVTFQDSRFSFMHRRFGVTGGNAINRSEERNRQEIAYLERKWGQWLRVKQAKSTTRLIVEVPRQQTTIRLANSL